MHTVPSSTTSYKPEQQLEWPQCPDQLLCGIWRYIRIFFFLSSLSSCVSFLCKEIKALIITIAVITCLCWDESMYTSNRLSQMTSSRKVMGFIPVWWELHFICLTLNSDFLINQVTPKIYCEIYSSPLMLILTWQSAIIDPWWFSIRLFIFLWKPNILMNWNLLPSASVKTVSLLRTS